MTVNMMWELYWKYRGSRSQIGKKPVLESLIIKVASLRSATLLKRHSNTGEICEIFKNTYFVEYLRTAAPDGIVRVMIVNMMWELYWKYTGSRSQMFFKIEILKHFTNLTGKHLRWSFFVIKLQALRPETLLKTDSNTGIFLWYFQIFKENIFLQNISGGCFWI